MLLTDRQEEVNDLETQDREVFDNLRGSAPHNLEKHWRLYKSKGLIPPSVRDKENAGKFNPDYVPCIYPVKIDKTRPWDEMKRGVYTNIKRCDHELPKTYEGEDGKTYKAVGKEAAAIAEIHCEEHVDWYLETHSVMEDGRKRPPRNTKIEVPVWVESLDEDPYATVREKRVARMRNRMSAKKATKEEVVEAVNEQIESRRRGKPKKEE
jgi:hypothetical protein